MKRELFTVNFWLDAVERAIKTGAQVVLLALGFGGVMTVPTSKDSEVVNAFLWNWRTLLGALLGGVLISVLMSVASAKATGTPSGSLLE